MKRNCEIVKFTAGDTKEHEGITYKAVRQENKMCEGCAFYKRGETCKGPRGWLCVEIWNDLIFKEVK